MEPRHDRCHQALEHGELLMRPRRHSEQGFTLIELLVGMSIGTIVMLAAFGLVDSGSAASKRVTDRVEATQIGRGAMEEVMQDLRSAVCVWQGGTTYLKPFADVSNANQVTFYRQLYGPPSGATDPGKTGTIAPQKVVLAVTGGKLVETVYPPGGVGPLGTPTPAPWNWATTPSTHVLASNDKPVSPGADYFTYYAYATGPAAPTGAPPPLSIGAGNVAAADLPRIVKVRAQFLFGPLRNTTNGTDHYVSLRDEASLSLPVDYTSGDTASQGGTCT
jgi:prepilin-type N-terminal cleavage/methylation domain-containing protein